MAKTMCMLMFAVFVAGCVSISGPPATNEDRTRLYDDVAYSHMFEAVRAAFLKLGAQITVLDEDRGLLNGKVRLTSDLRSPSLRSPLQGRTRMIYTYYDAIILRTDGEGIKAKLNIVTSYEDGFMPSDGDKTVRRQVLGFGRPKSVGTI